MKRRWGVAEGMRGDRIVRKRTRIGKTLPAKWWFGEFPLEYLLCTCSFACSSVWHTFRSMWRGGTRRALTARRCPIQLGYATDPRPATLLPGPVSSNSSEFLTPPPSPTANSAMELTAWPQQRSNHITWTHRSHYPALDPLELESHSNFSAGKG